MRIYPTIKIFPFDNNTATAVAVIKSVCKNISGFKYETKKSIEYAKCSGSPACYVVKLLNDEYYAVLSFKTNKQKNNITFLELINIIPREKSCIKPEEYREIVLEFFRAFRPSLRKQGLKIQFVKVDKLILQNIISGKYTRDIFQNYINRQQMGWGNFSHHPGTTDALDLFIITLDKYRSQINIQALYAYMIEVLDWKEEDAKWVRDRIITGTEILKRRRKFK